MDRKKLKQFCRKAALQEGFALAYVLFLGLLITTLLFMIFGYVVISKKVEAKRIIKKRLDLACYSAVQMVLADTIGDEDYLKNLIVDSINVSLSKRQNGLFYEIIASAKRGKDSSRYLCTVGAVPDTLYNNALVVTNPNLNGVIADNVTIKGDIISATNRFTKERIFGKNDGGISIEGKFKSHGELPAKLYKENNIVNEFYKTKRKDYDSEIEGNLTIDEKNFLIYRDKRIKIKGDLLLSGNIETKKYLAIEASVSGSLKIADSFKSTLGFYIYSDSGMTAGKNCHIENLTLLTGGRVTIGDNSVFENTQIIGKNDITVTGALFKYPSVLCLYADELQKKADKTIYIKESKINGFILLVTPVTGSAVNRSRIKIDNSSRLKGFLYSENYLEMGGSMDGCLCFYNLYYYKSPTEYINWLTDIKVNRNNLEAGFLMPPGFSQKERYEILQEKWIY